MNRNLIIFGVGIIVFGQILFVMGYTVYNDPLVNIGKTLDSIIFGNANQSNEELEKYLFMEIFGIVMMIVGVIVIYGGLEEEEEYKYNMRRVKPEINNNGGYYPEGITPSRRLPDKNIRPYYKNPNNLSIPKCPHCGARINSRWKACPECGEYL